jgi:hypothetical protein
MACVVSAALRLGIVPSPRIPLLGICLQICGKQFFYKENQIMKDQIVVKDEAIRKAIKKYYPRVDLNCPMKRSDLDTLLKGIEWKQKGAEINKRKETIKNKTIVAGFPVKDDEGMTYVVSGIRADGYVCLKGRRGGFSPEFLTRA